jgi:ribonuclease BN (tRNA processing enzyme)
VRLTVLGTGTARPVPDNAASGLVVRADGTTVLFDCGSGIASRVEAAVGVRTLDAIVVGHFHADHWIDLAPLRYKFPWGERSNPRLPIFLPPGGNERLEHLAAAINERPGFFQDAFEVHEYQAGEAFEIGELRVTPSPVRHYVPAWSMGIVGPEGRRIVYAGDMGPSDELVAFARDADLLILEATLERAEHDDVRRGHLTTEEAIDHAVRAGARRALLVHYPPERREAIAAICATTDGLVEPALAGTTYEV